MNIAIVDDEKKCREQIKNLLTQFDPNFSIELYNDGEELLVAQISKYDIVYLDIEMPGISGIDLANIIGNKNPKVVIFYVSSHTALVTKAIRNHAFQFLPKPIDEEDFRIELVRALQTMEIKRTKIKINRKGIESFIFIEEIMYIETVDKLTTLHMNKGLKIETGMKLSEMLELLKKYGFAQSHKSFIINLDKVLSVEASQVYLVDNTTVPIGRNYREAFKDILNQFMNGITL